MNACKLLSCILFSVWTMFAYGYEQSSCDDPAAVEIIEPLTGYTGYIAEYDGFIMGANGCLYSHEEFIAEDVEPLVMDGSSVNEAVIWVVNGAGSDPLKLYAKMQLLSEKSGQPVIGIYNGYFDDFDLKDTSLSVVPHVLTKNMRQSLGSNTPVHLYGGSLGGTLIAKGLFNLEHALLEIGYNRSELRSLMGTINVETIGAAHGHFPDGPGYAHYVNHFDPIPKAFGVLMRSAHPGEGAVVVIKGFIRFDHLLPSMLGIQWQDMSLLEKSTIAVHGFFPYLRDRLPFDMVRGFAKDNGKVRYIRRSRIVEYTGYQE